VETSDNKDQRLPEREVQIAARLKEAREFLRLSQKEFAEGVGIRRERLASYEDARVPLRWEIALRLCRRFFISEEWLATGLPHYDREGGHPTAPFPAELDFGKQVRFGVARATQMLSVRPIVQTLKPGMLFSEAFDRHLAKEFEKLLMCAYAGPSLVVLQTDSPEYLQYALGCMAGYWIAMLDDAVRQRFLQDVLGAGAILFTELRGIGADEPAYEGELANIIERQLQSWDKNNAIKILTESYTSRNVSGVKSPMKILLGRVSLATKARGKKAALAKFLKLPPPRVSEWLHGAGEPSGEIALRLLEWVTAEEAQQKSPGDVTSATKGKTHLTESKTNEKRKTSHKQE